MAKASVVTTNLKKNTAQAERMEKAICIQLLDEGTLVYRPVLSIQMGHNVYKVGGESIYDLQNEQWQFLPNTIVQVEEKHLGGENVLVAVKRVDNTY